jgi:hypothetical protein
MIASTMLNMNQQENPEIEKLARHIAVYYQASSAVLRSRLFMGFMLICTFLAAVFAATGNGALCLAALALAASTWLIYFVINGVAGQSYVAGRVGRFILGLRIGDKMLVLVGMALLAGVVIVFNLMWVCIAAAILALGAHLTIDRVVKNERQRPIEQIEQILKDLRREGTDDVVLRQIICEQGDSQWELLFEELFGYKAKIVARRKWGKDELGRLRPKDRPWRDAMVKWLELRMAAREETQVVDAIDDSSQKLPEPPQQAAMPQVIIASPPPLQASPPQPPQPGQVAAPQAQPGQVNPAQVNAPPPPPAQPTYNVQAAERERQREARDRSIFGSRPAWPLGFILGARIRFLIGSLLISGCLYWMHQNNLVPQQSIIEITQQLRETRKVENLDAKRQQITQQMDVRDKDTSELHFGNTSPEVTQWFNGYGPGVAGLLLIIGSLFRGAKISFFMYPAAAVAMFGQAMNLPTIGPIAPEYTSLVFGAALGVIGVMFGRVRM